MPASLEIIVRLPYISLFSLAPFLLSAKSRVLALRPFVLHCHPPIAVTNAVLEEQPTHSQVEAWPGCQIDTLPPRGQLPRSSCTSNNIPSYSVVHLIASQAVQSVQVVVDASKHAPAGVDVHVRMVLEADGQLVRFAPLRGVRTLLDLEPQRACNVQHIVETPSPSSNSSTSSSPSPPERHALPPQPLNACHVRMEAARRLHPQPALPAVKPEDLVPYDIIGAGGQGSVMAVLHKPTQQLFAMKIITKDEHNRRMLELVFREQAASLELVGCHFFAQLRASWEDNTNFYLLFVRSFPTPVPRLQLTVSAGLLFRRRPRQEDRQES